MLAQLKSIENKFEKNLIDKEISKNLEYILNFAYHLVVKIDCDSLIDK